MPYAIHRQSTQNSPVIVSPISQSDINALLSHVGPGESLREVLVAHGYSNELSHLKIENHAHHPIDFSGCHFDHVSFNGDFQQSQFANTHFVHTNFAQADFSGASFNQASFSQSSFVNSNLSSTSFHNTQLEKTKVVDCDFSDASFSQSQIKESVFSKINFSNTLDYENTVDNLHIIVKQDYSNDYTFLNATFDEVKPNVAILDDQDWHDTPYNVIMNYDGQPITVPFYSHEHNDFHLSSEVENALKQINSSGLTMSSIAKQVIESDQPIINQIKEYAFNIMMKSDAVWIPGGSDLHPAFYGEENTDSYPSWSYYREILEFSLADAAITLGKPIIGVCHGTQLVNVFLGGTLHQDIQGWGNPVLEVHTHKGLLGSVIEGDIIGMSMHHQAVKDLGANLEVVASYDGIIKAVQATDDKQIMLTQFHPEYEVDQNSINILSKFMDLSADSAMNKKMLEISDIINIEDNILDPLDGLQRQDSVQAQQTGIETSSFIPEAQDTGWFDTVYNAFAELLMPDFNFDLQQTDISLF